MRTLRMLAAAAVLLTLATACPSETAAPPPSPMLEPADPRDAFVPLDGYRYRRVGRAVREQMEQQLTTDPDAAEVLQGFDARFALAGEDAAILVLSMAMDPEAAGDPRFAEGLYVGFAQSFGGSLGEEEIAGQEVRVGTSEGGAAVLWQKGALVIGVIGEREDLVRDIATQIIEGMSG